jgi:hypothetical protein
VGLADLKRVTDLFVEGDEVVLREGPEPVLLWVNKLNPFEQEEARRDGAAARARVILALKEIASPESAIFEANVLELGPVKLKEAIVNAKSSDHFLRAVDAIRSDPEWSERVEASMRRSDDMPEEEKAAVDLIDADYAVELSKRVNDLRDEAMRDLDGFDIDALRGEYRQVWLEGRGLAAFSREFQKSQLFYAVRICRATSKNPLGDEWDHTPCEGHRTRLLGEREDVTKLPDGLLERLRTAVSSISVERRDARFSDALASSSESSAQPSEEGPSTLSTPVETSPELATTSS